MTEATNTKTFDDFDKFERKDFADRLTKVVSTFYPFADEAYVLSLNGSFGSGKSTFLEMWGNKLKDDGYTVISINAWETDFDNEPIIPIISAILNNIKPNKDDKNLKNTLFTTLGSITNQVIDHTTGVDLKKTKKQATDKYNEKEIIVKGKEIYNQFSYKVEAYKQLKDSLLEYICTLNKKPLIIFVDELDRARPDYSINFLEAIKHIFSVHGIFFVLAVAKDQLEKSVKHVYGDIDFENYYRRFITREFDLPNISNKNIVIREYIRYLVKDFIDEKRTSGIKFPFKESNQNSIISFTEDICKVSNFQPRTIETLMRIFSQLMAINTNNTNLATHSWIDASILLISIYIKDRKLYHKIGTTHNSVEDLIAYIVNLQHSNSKDYYSESFLMELALAFYISEKNIIDHDRIASVCYSYIRKNNNENITPEIKSNLIDSLAKKVDNWPRLRTEHAFEHLYNYLEKWLPLFS